MTKKEDKLPEVDPDLQILMSSRKDEEFEVKSDYVDVTDTDFTGSVIGSGKITSSAIGHNAKVTAGPLRSTEALSILKKLVEEAEKANEIETSLAREVSEKLSEIEKLIANANTPKEKIVPHLQRVNELLDSSIDLETFGEQSHPHLIKAIPIGSLLLSIIRNP